MTDTIVIACSRIDFILHCFAIVIPEIKNNHEKKTVALELIYHFVIFFLNINSRCYDERTYFLMITSFAL